MRSTGTRCQPPWRQKGSLYAAAGFDVSRISVLFACGQTAGSVNSSPVHTARQSAYGASVTRSAITFAWSCTARGADRT